MWLPQGFSPFLHVVTGDHPSSCVWREPGTRCESRRRRENTGATSKLWARARTRTCGVPFSSSLDICATDVYTCFDGRFEPIHEGMHERVPQRPDTTSRRCWSALAPGASAPTPHPQTGAEWVCCIPLLPGSLHFGGPRGRRRRDGRDPAGRRGLTVPRLPSRDTPCPRAVRGEHQHQPMAAARSAPASCR